MNTLLADYISTITLGEPRQLRNLTVFPIFSANGHGREFLTLAEALQNNLVTLTEISQSGQVPNLKLTNAADVPVLLVEGEELIGAKQNRVLNTTILVNAKSETIIPVSCTEAGRWSYSSPSFKHSGHLSPHKLRKLKSSSVAAALRGSQGHKSDQHAVWNGIAMMAGAANVQSSTHALHDIVTAKGLELEEFVRAFTPSPNQKGLLVVINGEVTGFDVLSSDRAYQVLHPKFVKSYALDALLTGARPDSESAREQATGFLEESKTCSEQIYQAVGCGSDHRFEGQKIAGFALVDEDNVIHMNLYRN